MKQLCPRCLSTLHGRVCSCGFVAGPRSEYAMALPNYVVLHGRYLVLQVLGAGGFGVTYKAMDLRNKQICAIKEYVPLGVAYRQENGCIVPEISEKIGIYEHGKQRFLEEAYVLLKLNHLPHTVTVRGCFEENATAYYVMDFVEGKTLTSEVMGGGRIPLPRALQIIRSVGQTLHWIHTEANILHRDISPENIMLRPDGQAILLDFGSAKSLAGAESQKFTVVLKAGYAPPEQYSSAVPQGAYTDVYALAATFYYMVTGTKVPEAPKRSTVGYMPLHQMDPGIPQSVSDAVDRALVLNRRERTQSCSRFLQELLAGYLPETEVSQGAGKGEPSMVVSMGNYSSSHRLEPGKVYRVGRLDGCDVVLPRNKSISGVHLFLYYNTSRQRFVVKDVSRNGVYLGNRRLEKEKFCLLRPGSILYLADGSCSLRLQLV